MAQTSFALLTNIGRQKEAAALGNGTALVVTHIAIGDGATVPSGGETQLYHEVLRKTISGQGVVAGATNVAYADIFLAADEGPFTIREAGLFDSAGDLIAIARYDPPVNKPVPGSGQTVEGIVRIEVAFSNTANVTITVDPAISVSLQRLSNLPWVPVASKTVTAPPASPPIGATYLIPAGATGVWSGQSGKITEFTSAGWAFLSPKDGHGVGLPDGRVFIRKAGVYVDLFQANLLSADIPVAGWQNAPPASPASGDRYVVGTAPTGAWAGQANKIATWLDSTWAFLSPVTGLIANFWNGTREVILFWTGTAWTEKAVSERAQDLNFRSAGGTANALTVTLDPIPANYTELVGAPLRVKIVATNTGAATINVNGLGAKPIVRLGAGSALAANDLLVGGIYTLTYDGTSFQVTTSGGAALVSGTSTVKAPKLVSLIADGLGAVTSIPSSVATLIPFTARKNQLAPASSWSGTALSCGDGDGGLWLVQATVHMEPGSGGAYTSVSVFKNGSETILSVDSQGNSGDAAAPSCSGLIEMAPGDYLQVFAYQQTGSTKNTTGTSRTRFQAALISAT